MGSLFISLLSQRSKRDPQGVVKGTKMGFSGLQKDEEIKAVIAYLATFDKDGMAPK